MNKVEKISYENFCIKYDVKNIDLVSRGLFKESDIDSLRKLSGYISGHDKIKNILLNLPTYFKNFEYYSKNFKKVLENVYKDLLFSSKIKNLPLSEQYPINDYNMKASIIASFSPKNILEIGTFFGWGAASLKFAIPSAEVFTMNPEINSIANNPINVNRIGEVFKSRNINVHQIWADSTNFDYKNFQNLDAAYIDGNHEYEYVFCDLTNLSKIVNKVILLDDYIPNSNSPRGGVRSWGPWNASVVAAVNDFLESNPRVFKSCYWIENSPIAVLIK